jgi:hypothetical protein
MSGLPDYDTDPVSVLKWWLDHFSRRRILVASDIDIIRGRVTAAITKLEDEIERLKARRCEACASLTTCYIGCEASQLDSWREDGVGCNCWSPRTEEGSE